MTTTIARDWERLAREFIHPTKLRILAELENSDEPLSPSAMAERFDERLGNVSYHVRELLSRGLLTETHTEQRRGALEHFYRLT